jgi:hypothetical protein
MSAALHVIHDSWWLSDQISSYMQLETSCGIRDFLTPLRLLLLGSWLTCCVIIDYRRIRGVALKQTSHRSGLAQNYTNTSDFIVDFPPRETGTQVGMPLSRRLLAGSGYWTAACLRSVKSPGYFIVAGASIGSV